jgi:hypothetical protein
VEHFGSDLVRDSRSSVKIKYACSGGKAGAAGALGRYYAHGTGGDRFAPGPPFLIKPNPRRGIFAAAAFGITLVLTISLFGVVFWGIESSVNMVRLLLAPTIGAEATNIRTEDR